MGFVELENMGKQALEQLPLVKRSAKRAYQFANVVASSEKFKSKGDVVKVSPDDGFEYFYGYYDKSPWDITNRFMLCLKVRQAYKSVAPKETGVVGVIDTFDGNKFIKVGVTHSWNVQQGCMAQWMGPDYGKRIIYNDFRNGNYCSIIYNWEDRKVEKVLPLPIYDVARDGGFALSLDFSRLHRMRPGYGYSNIPDATKGVMCPDQACIWKMDISSGTVTELFKYTDFATFEPDKSMQGAEHKVNHLMISPNCRRFMVLHRWFQKGRKHTRLVTANVDKTEMYNLSDDVFVSHCYWKNDDEILSFLRKKETGNHYYLMKDRTQEYKTFWPELNTDGHCSYSPDGNLIITDTYPNRKRIASVYLCTEGDNKSRKIASVSAPFRYDNDCRCDLHPRWDRKGDKICIDSVHEGKRGLYIIPNPLSVKATVGEEKIPRIIHNVWFGTGTKSRIAKRSEESWSTFCPSYTVMEWNEDTFDLSDGCPYVKEAYDAKKWAFVSDYVRLKVLYEHGGIYFDSDMEVLKNFDRFLKYRGFFCAESHFTVSTAIIAAEPHAPWIKDLLDEYEHIFFINKDGSMNKLPNTKRVQRYLEEKYGYHWSDKPQELEEGLIVFPSEYFSPLNCFTGEMNMTENSYTIHHYDNTWKSSSDKLKKKIMQMGTRIIGEDNRAKLVELKSKSGKTKKLTGGGYRPNLITLSVQPSCDSEESCEEVAT